MTTDGAKGAGWREWALVGPALVLTALALSGTVSAGEGKAAQKVGEWVGPCLFGMVLGAVAVGRWLGVAVVAVVAHPVFYQVAVRVYVEFTPGWVAYPAAGLVGAVLMGLLCVVFERRLMRWVVGAGLAGVVGGFAFTMAAKSGREWIGFVVWQVGVGCTMAAGSRERRWNLVGVAAASAGAAGLMAWQRLG